MKSVYAPRARILRYGEKRAGRIPHNCTRVNGIDFDSQSEADRYVELLVLQKSGTISDLVVQPHFDLIPTQKVPGHQTFRPHGYTADFQYVRDGKTIVEDVKSKRTREERDYVINRKLMWMLHGIYVEEILK